MNHLVTLVHILFWSLFSLASLAADIPQDDIGGQELNQIQCVDDATDNCINEQCLTSEEIDCEGNCRTMAQEQCQEQNAE